MSLDAALERLRAGRPRAALPLLESHIAGRPTDARAWFLLGTCRHELRDTAGALEAFERSIALSPDPNGIYASAVVLEDLGRADDALARYGQTLQRDPAHADALHNRGLLLARLGRLMEAERSHRTYVALHPDAARAHADLADALLALSRYQEAIDGIDLLIDAAGHTAGSRFEITAHRPAPVQVLYLAFPSTLGSSRVDYAIVDRIVVPPGSEQHWSEALVYLPDTYYLYDYRQPLPSETFARADYGLTAEGVVFCACHKPEKITPDEFDLWLRVLSQVPGAALWLNAMPAAGAENLRREAAAHGTDPRRLVFAPFDPRDRYLARQRLGDLLLDAVHRSTMTTACDALAAGLPVLTLKGASLASRAGESLLRAAGMPELVAAGADAFVRAAAALGNDPAILGGLKAKLRANRASAPLFDTTARVRQLEAAFAEMHRRHRAGVAPASFGL